MRTFNENVYHIYNSVYDKLPRISCKTTNLTVKQENDLVYIDAYLDNHSYYETYVWFKEQTLVKGQIIESGPKHKFKRVFTSETPDGEYVR